MKQIYTFLLATFVMFSFLSCTEYAKIQKTQDYMVRYEYAKEMYACGQYDRAALMLQDVIMVLKGTDHGEESLYLSGMTNFRARNYSAAAAYFKKYYQTYPRGKFTEEAQYYSGKSLQENAPEPRLDQTGTFEAVSEYQSFLENYPTSRFADDASQAIFDLQDKLVEKEYLSAKLYYDLGTYFMNCSNGGSNYQACIITAQNAILDYPYTKRREDLSFLILKAKFELAENSVESKKEERYRGAIDEYYGFTSEFPESKYMKDVESLFKKAKKYHPKEDSEK